MAAYNFILEQPSAYDLVRFGHKSTLVRKKTEIVLTSHQKHNISVAVDVAGKWLDISLKITTGSCLQKSKPQWKVVSGLSATASLCNSQHENQLIYMYVYVIWHIM